MKKTLLAAFIALGLSSFALPARAEGDEGAGEKPAEATKETKEKKEKKAKKKVTADKKEEEKKE